MSKKTLLTAEGLAEIQKELTHLKEDRRIEIAEKLKEAISFGDLSENSEYEDARNEQAQVELRIAELEEIFKNYELVDSKKAQKKRDVVAIGSSVTVKSGDNAKETYKIVGPTETDIFEGKISNESPLGASLIGKAVGDVAKGKSPAGAFEFEILEVK
jgi:transcription elongation factor GreA